MNEIDDARGYLKYILENCLFAYDELCKVNKELKDEMKDLNSNVDVNYLGAMNRMVQDYLIIRVGGLFDKTEYKIKSDVDVVVSFEKLFSNNPDYQLIKKQKIIQSIIDQRHNFVAHPNKEYALSNFPNTTKILNSNIRKQLVNLMNLL